MALSTNIPGPEAVDNINVNNYSEVNRLFGEQLKQLAFTDMIRGHQQRQLALLAAVRRESANLRDQNRGRSRSRTNKIDRELSPTVAPSIIWGTTSVSEGESSGGSDAAPVDPERRKATAKMAEKNKVSRNNSEAVMMKDISDNSRV